jgi:hypothetical protein
MQDISRLAQQNYLVAQSFVYQSNKEVWECKFPCNHNRYLRYELEASQGQ